VDVYSYAMCLVELVDCKLPWAREGMFSNGPAEVPLKVTRGDRPHKQLEGSAAAPLDPRMASLIRDCWQQAPHQRPDFTTIALRLEEMMGRMPSRSTSRSGSAADGSSNNGGVARQAFRGKGASTLEPLLEADEEAPAPGVTRPASPER
jgi:hypothetical protein